MSFNNQLNSQNISQASPQSIYSSPKFYPYSPTLFNRHSPSISNRPPSFQLNKLGNRNPSGLGSYNSYINPLSSLTLNLSPLYNRCNNLFNYQPSDNPRRVLTKPSKPCHNQGYDNQDNDYILYVNDWLGGDNNSNKYLILDILGQGTFGQVVKCQNSKTGEIVAIKVIKNKPAYFNQSMMEVTILELLNNQFDPNDDHHILRLRDQFIHCRHLCLVFEILSSNLYELIKQNSFRGLSTSLVKVFTSQLLDALVILNEARLIHCDLKPENILLKSLQSPQIKVIDFGSACHERQTVYTYIQSRFYRSPEVLLGMPYSSAIDMWSLGCIAVELFLGLPLFPGTSEYNQISRIVDMLGSPPSFMLQSGKQSHEFFDSISDEFGRKQFRLKSLEKFSQEHGTQEQPSKKYFNANTLPEIIKQYPISSSKSRNENDIKKEQANRVAFIHFVQGLLNMNPIERWSPQQARLHPFITGEKFTGSWSPPPLPSGNKSGSPSGSTLHASSSTSISPNNSHHSSNITSPTSHNEVINDKRPYGGLQTTSKSPSRPYQNAAAYNQQLANQQSYVAQQNVAQVAAANAYRNPFPPPPPPATNKAQPPLPSTFNSQRYPEDLYQDQRVKYKVAQQQQSQRASAVASATMNYAMPPPPPPPQTKNWNQMDIVPPQLARIAAMSSQESLGGRGSMTPVINRDEAMREWERRQNMKSNAASYVGHQKRSSWQQYPQLEYLQEQAERASHNYIGNRYAYGPPSNNGSNHNITNNNSFSVIVDPNTNLNPSATSTTTNNNNTTQPITIPPQSYQQQQTTTTMSTPTSSNRYNPHFPQTTYDTRHPHSTTSTTQHHPSVDTYSGNDGLGTLYVPLIPTSSSSTTTTAQPNYNNQPTTPTSFIPPPPTTTTTKVNGNHNNSTPTQQAMAAAAVAAAGYYGSPSNAYMMAPPPPVPQISRTYSNGSTNSQSQVPYYNDNRYHKRV